MDALVQPPNCGKDVDSPQNSQPENAPQHDEAPVDALVEPPELGVNVEAPAPEGRVPEAMRAEEPDAAQQGHPEEPPPPPGSTHPNPVLPLVNVLKK